MSKELLMQVFENLVNKNREKAGALLHEYFVQTGRIINESLMNEELDEMDEVDEAEELDEMRGNRRDRTTGGEMIRGVSHRHDGIEDAVDQVEDDDLLRMEMEDDDMDDMDDEDYEGDMDDMDVDGDMDDDDDMDVDADMDDMDVDGDMDDEDYEGDMDDMDVDADMDGMDDDEYASSEEFNELADEFEELKQQFQELVDMEDDEHGDDYDMPDDEDDGEEYNFDSDDSSDEEDDEDGYEEDDDEDEDEVTDESLEESIELHATGGKNYWDNHPNGEDTSARSPIKAKGTSSAAGGKPVKFSGGGDEKGRPTPKGVYNASGNTKDMKNTMSSAKGVLSKKGEPVTSPQHGQGSEKNADNKKSVVGSKGKKSD